MSTLKFDLGQEVGIQASGEVGVVVGRAEYTASEPSYQVRYKNALGVAVTEWWVESALRSV